MSNNIIEKLKKTAPIPRELLLKEVEKYNKKVTKDILEIEKNKKKIIPSSKSGKK